MSLQFLSLLICHNPSSAIRRKAGNPHGIRSIVSHYLTTDSVNTSLYLSLCHSHNHPLLSSLPVPIFGKLPFPSLSNNPFSGTPIFYPAIFCNTQTSYSQGMQLIRSSHLLENNSNAVICFSSEAFTAQLSKH